MKNRKLFPTANPTNATECFGDCEPISGIIYSQPPPPPPPLPLPSPLVVPNQADQSHGLSPSVIVLVTLLGSFSLLVGYYVVVSKACFGLCKRRNRSENPPPSDGGDEELVDDNHGVDHPIWFITTVGLQQSMINSITVVKYKRNEGLIEGTECSVCLNEFRENETLRLLPKCSHAFHTPCIDTWLRSHTNCPLCRAHIVSDSNTNRRLEPGNRNGGGGDGIEEAQMGNNSQNGNGQRVDQDGTNSNNNNNSNGSCVLEVGNDNGEMAGNDQVRLMRSVSVDSSSSWLVIAKKIGEMEENHVLGRSNREVGQKQCLRMSPVVMKRSLSCGGRFLSSRPNQRLNSVLLPL